MSFTRESAAERAIRDLSGRLGLDSSKVRVESVSEKDFPDMSLGANVPGEMAAQMISSGWQIRLGAAGKSFEYRADKYQLRLVGFNGTNYVIES